MGKMLNARRVCLGNTLILLPVLIVMLATLVMGLQAANCALSTLRQSREAQHVYATGNMLDSTALFANLETFKVSLVRVSP
jgi:hypothetical protein